MPPHRLPGLFGPELNDLTGARYLAELVRQIAREQDLSAALVCHLIEPGRVRARTAAVFLDGEHRAGFEYALAGTPCARVAGGHRVVIPADAARLYPSDPWFSEHSIEAFVAAPLFDLEGRVIGWLAALDREPLADADELSGLLDLVSRRAGAELERCARSDALRARAQRLAQQKESLHRLACHPALAAGDPDAFLEEATRLACATLEVSRVNAWRYDDDGEKLVCVASLPRAATPVEPLRLAEYPDYFAAFGAERVVATVDARSDPRTRSLADDYLVPLGITSMLEAAIRSGGDQTGVLCCEHVGDRREWHDDEESFVASLADLISLAFEAADRRRADRERTTRNRELAALQRIGELALGSDAKAENLLEVLTEIRRATGFPAASVQLYDADGEGLLFESGLERAGRPVRLPPLEGNDSGLCVVEHVDQELAARVPFLAEIGAGRCLSVPLISRGNRFGTLLLTDPEPGPIEEHSIRFATSLGHALAVYLERQRARQDEGRMKVQLLQSRKLEAIGTLAAGIAHDFNNLLTGILGFAWQLKQGTQPGEPVDLAASAIENAAERASELTHRLLGFARRGPGQATAVELKDVVHEAARLLDRTLDENVDVGVDFDDQRSTILADPGQIHLMLLNMAVNARDAMPAGGTLTFAVRRASTPGGEPDRIELDVLDTGTGIPAERLDRVFEPFYTTKEVGQGTGMGLAMVYGIVQSHSGSIQVENRPEGGARFRIRFPAAESGASTRPEERPVYGRGRILVVDDEDFARDAAAELLTSLGYTVATASSGSEAIAIVEEAPQDIDLVVLDIVMPRMGGRECLRALKRVDPHVRVVLASDWSLEGIAHLGLNQDALGLVEKPFQLVQLSQIVASVLNTPSSEPALP